MTFWLLLTVNSVTFGGLLFLLSAGFSLIFGLMRIPNLTHGSMFMAGAYLGTTLLAGTLGFTLDFWLASVIAALEVAILGGLMERLLLRRLPRRQLGGRSRLGGNSGRAGRLCAHRPRGVPALPDGGHPDRRRVRGRALADARTHAARRHDPGWRRRPADGSRRRHPGIPAVHHRVCARRRTRGLCRDDRGSDSLRLSRSRPGHAAARSRGRHPRRHRKPARLVRRPHRYRFHLQFRPGARARAGLFRAVSADGAGARTAAAGFVRRTDPVIGGTRIAGVVAILALAAAPYAIKEIYYVNIASQILLYAIFALGLSVLVGYAGLVSLGHAGLFGVAAYAAAYLLAAGYGHAVAVLAALAIALLATAAFAALSLRATGISF